MKDIGKWLVILVVLALAMKAPAQERILTEGQRDMLVYFGTYTGSKSQSRGIYVSRLDAATGEVSPPELAVEASSPAFLAIHPNKAFLYAVHEDWKTGGAGAYSIDPATGRLTRINTEPTGGKGPCYVSIDPAGKNLLIADYGNGKVAVLPIADDGSLKPLSSAIQHEGSGPDERRQKEPHAHSINPGPTGRFAFAADLGIDKILIYRLDADKGELSANDPAFAAVAPGAGPRHLAFHPDGAFAYVINEMGNTITAFRHDAEKGTLSRVGDVSTLPADFSGSNTTAEVAVHPSGRFVYGSNRGHDSIAIFSVDASTGALAPRGHVGTQGKTPRHFAIDPAGRYLLVANQGSNSIVVFRIQEDGSLTPTGQTLEIDSPCCVKFLVP